MRKSRAFLKSNEDFTKIEEEFEENEPVDYNPQDLYGKSRASMYMSVSTYMRNMAGVLLED